MFQSKTGQSFTNRPAAARHDRMAEQQKPEAKPQASQHKTVTIHHDGQQFHVIGGNQDKTHHDVDSALHHAKAIFGGHSGSDDTAFEASGEETV